MVKFSIEHQPLYTTSNFNSLTDVENVFQRNSVFYQYIVSFNLYNRKLKKNDKEKNIYIVILTRF
jgi:hypothetical protein